MKIVITAVLIGALAGLAGALLGVGGGIIMVPAFTKILGLEQKNAVATSLAIIVITAGIGTSYHITKKTELIDWKLVGFAAVAAAVAAWLGSDLMRSLSNVQLKRIFGVVLVLVGVQMLFLKK